MNLLPESGVHDPQTRQTIVRLLSSMAGAKEISQYLKRFSQLDAARFAVVKVGGAVLRDDLDALTSSLAFLQDVGLTPIVIHGAGPQLDETLSAAGIEKHTVNGLRVTSPEALAIVRKVFHVQNLKLVEALQAREAAIAALEVGNAWTARVPTGQSVDLVSAVCQVGAVGIIVVGLLGMIGSILLNNSQYNKTAAAKTLGIAQSTLYDKLKKFGL